MSSGFDRAARELCGVLGNRPDPRTSVWADFSPALRPRAALLASVLGQDLTIAGLARLLRELRASLGEDALLGLASCSREDLGRACGARTWLSEWPHRASLDGWIRSTLDFLGTHGDPGSWETRFGQPRELVGALAMEIPWMGSGSPSRVKGWRLARWLVRGEVGPGWSGGLELLRTPVKAVERPLGALGWQPTHWDGWTRPKRQAWWDDFSAQVDPSDPARLWLPMETVLARGRAAPACQESLGGCRKCPVRSWCPSPQRM